jgi:glycine cleavage system H protein
MKFPSDVKYTEHDEWVRVEGDVLTLGISDYAQDALGELVHIELPELGDSVQAGDSIAEVESTKAVSDIYTPVDGEVIAVNGKLDDAPETVNEDPYGAGWLVKIRIADASGLDGLLDAAAYQAKVSD